MAIVNIHAEKSDFIGLQCWLKLLCVNYQGLSVAIVAYYFSPCLLSVSSKFSLCPRGPSHTFVVHTLFLLLGVCNFRIWAVIITHHYGSSWDMHVEPASVGREEEEDEGGAAREREKPQRTGKKKCDSWGSVSGWWVQKGQDLELAVLFSTACLVSLRNANQTAYEALPSSPPPLAKKKLSKKAKKFVCLLFFFLS